MSDFTFSCDIDRVEAQPHPKTEEVLNTHTKSPSRRVTTTTTTIHSRTQVRHPCFTVPFLTNSYLLLVDLKNATSTWHSSSPAELTHLPVSSKATRTSQSSARTAATGVAKFIRDGQLWIVLVLHDESNTIMGYIVLTFRHRRQWFTFCFVVRLFVGFTYSHPADSST